MRIFIRYAVFIFLTLCFSCEKSDLYLVNCPDCTSDEPAQAELDIRLDLNENERTEINVYEGNLEDSILYATFRTNGKSTTYNVPVNKKFTLTATYSISGIKYIAVDSAFPHVKYDKNSCDEPCYFVYNKVVNLKLKYTN